MEGKDMHLEERDTSLDVIRIIAIFFVLFTHTSNRGSKIYTNLVPGGGVLRSLHIIRYDTDDMCSSVPYAFRNSAIRKKRTL